MNKFLLSDEHFVFASRIYSRSDVTPINMILTGAVATAGACEASNKVLPNAFFQMLNELGCVSAFSLLSSLKTVAMGYLSFGGASALLLWRAMIRINRIKSDKNLFPDHQLHNHSLDEKQMEDQALTGSSEITASTPFAGLNITDMENMAVVHSYEGLKNVQLMMRDVKVVLDLVDELRSSNVMIRFPQVLNMLEQIVYEMGALSEAFDNIDQRADLTLAALRSVVTSSLDIGNSFRNVLSTGQVPSSVYRVISSLHRCLLKLYGAGIIHLGVRKVMDRIHQKVLKDNLCDSNLYENVCKLLEEMYSISPLQLRAQVLLIFELFEVSDIAEELVSHMRREASRLISLCGEVLLIENIVQIIDVLHQVEAIVKGNYLNRLTVEMIKLSILLWPRSAEEGAHADSQLIARVLGLRALLRECKYLEVTDMILPCDTKVRIHMITVCACFSAMVLTKDCAPCAFDIASKFASRINRMLFRLIARAEYTRHSTWLLSKYSVHCRSCASISVVQQSFTRQLAISAVPDPGCSDANMHCRSLYLRVHEAINHVWPLCTVAVSASFDTTSDSDAIVLGDFEQKPEMVDILIRYIVTLTGSVEQRIFFAVNLSLSVQRSISAAIESLNFPLSCPPSLNTNFKRYKTLYLSWKWAFCETMDIPEILKLNFEEFLSSSSPDRIESSELSDVFVKTTNVETSLMASTVVLVEKFSRFWTEASSVPKKLKLMDNMQSIVTFIFPKSVIVLSRNRDQLKRITAAIQKAHNYQFVLVG